MRVLVTGGAGFIGSHIADALIREGHDVAVLDDLSTGREENVPAEATFFRVDLRDRVAVDEAVKDFAPDAISHQAAQASVKVSMDAPTFDADVNIVGGLNLLEAARAQGVDRFVFASTGGAIYGEVAEGKTADESWKPSPKSPYATSKAAFELYLEMYREAFGLQTTILRYGNVYGPRQDPHGEAGVVAIFAKRVLQGESIQVNARRTLGDAGCVRDYIHVNDVVSANVLAMTTDLVGTYNVGTSEPHTTKDIAEQILAASGASVEVRQGDHRAGDLEVSLLDATKLRQAGWAPSVPFADGIAETVSWFATQQ